MSTITQLTTVPADLIGAQAPTPAPAAQPSAPPKPAPAAAPATAPQAVDPSQRLVISEGAQAGVYVYTILDRATGQVLVQIPREEVVKLGARPGYTAGQVIDTKA